MVAESWNWNWNWNLNLGTSCNWGGRLLRGIVRPCVSVQHKIGSVRYFSERDHPDCHSLA